MPSFNYVGRDSRGKQVKGVIEANESSAVAEQLLRRQITATAITPAKKGRRQGGPELGIKATKNFMESLGFTSVSLDELIVFCRQMYALMRSGVPILRAINGMAEASSSYSLKLALTLIGQQLSAGNTLSTALHQHPKVFPPLFG